MDDCFGFHEALKHSSWTSGFLLGGVIFTPILVLIYKHQIGTAGLGLAPQSLWCLYAHSVFCLDETVHPVWAPPGPVWRYPSTSVGAGISVLGFLHSCFSEFVLFLPMLLATQVVISITTTLFCSFPGWLDCSCVSVWNFKTQVSYFMKAFSWQDGK